MILTQRKISWTFLIFFLWACGSSSDNTASESTGKVKEQETVPSKISQLSWICTNWGNRSEKGSLYESWTKTNDTVYSGKSFMISKNGDTLFSETVSLEQQGGDLFYIPVVKNQNEGKPVSFKLVSVAGGEFIFENKAHDFPQRVIYNNPHPDTLYARIEGDIDGKFNIEEFLMSRVK